MTLNRLDTHDRLQYLQKQDFDIGACCQNLIDQRPFGNHPFYIYAHARTCEDGATKRLIWQPRLTRPKPELNSMLFKAYPGSDEIKIIWILPDVHLWPQYATGNITESPIVQESIFKFQHNKRALEQPENDDLNDDQIDAIYREIAQEARRKLAETTPSL